ncbi:MAG: DUF4198 domain-containing protein [Planctomycetes bacterium]|nr:DUF4198 domain-containing protein [Planctomycetota bacterium]
MTNRIPIFLVCLGLLGSVRADEIVIDIPDTVRRGVEATVTVTKNGEPLAGATVTATCNPKSEMEADDPLGATDAKGQVKWTPKQTGIAKLSVNKGEATRNTVVLFERFPVNGLIIFLFAGTVLYGGIILAFQRMRREWAVIGHADGDEESEE